MDDPVADFMAITGCADEGLAIEFLSRCDFDLGSAVAAYTAEMNGTEAAPGSSSSPVPVVSEPDDVTEHVMQSPQPPPRGNPTLVDRVGSAFDPGVQLGVAPQNPFEVSTQTRLLNLFSYPAYVVRQTSSLETVCTRAREADRWVLVALVDSNFHSTCLPRDLWRNAQIEELSEVYLACFEVNVTTAYGERLAQEYRVADHPLPLLFLVDPNTTSRATEIYMDPARIEASTVVSQVLTFIADNGTPSIYAAAAAAESDVEEPHDAPLASHTTVDVDAEDGTSTRNTASPPREVESMPPSSVEAGELTTDTADVMVEPVTLDAYASEAPGAFRLRARLPSSTLTLQLLPSTPATEVIRYIAYKIHAADPAAYPVPPSIEVRSGFPPADVTVSDPEVAVSAWPNVRSGDNLMVRIK